MKITYEDTKKNIIELIPETLDDLWHLSHIIKKGDLVSAVTTRRIQDKSGERIRSDRGIKKTFRLTVRVESVKFHKYTGRLRVTGVIEKGPEDIVPLGSYHTLEVKLNKKICIKKEEWPKWAINRLKDAINASKELNAIILLIEENSAELGLLRQYGIEYYGPITGNISGKRIKDKTRDKKIIEFYEKIISSLKKFKDVGTIIIAGPGFAKDDFYAYLKDKYPKISKISIVESAGSGGRTGIQEVLRKGTVEKVLEKHRVARETREVNKILEKITKSPSLVVYGKDHVIEAANLGAIKKLLVLDTLLHDEKIESLVKEVEKMRGEVIVISSEHESGKQLKSIGGLAAHLRFKVK